MRLTDEELRDVLARAEEIQQSTRHVEDMKVDLETVLGAAEEVGLARSAVERALRERFDLPLEPPAAGDLVFAKSADGNSYVAEVLSVSADGARVRFLRGSEHTVMMDQLRPCAFLPGERVVVDWPWWGPWTCTVLAYDAAKQRLKVSDGWGSTKTFKVADVWVAPRKVGASRMRVVVTLLGAGAGLGAVIGSIITAMLMR